MPSHTARDRIAPPPIAETPELVIFNQQNYENQRVPDLVRDSRLTTRFLPSGATEHAVYRVSHQSPHRRPCRINETWYRQRELGNGNFGCVWLERCASGPAEGKLRAVNEIRIDPSLPVPYSENWRPWPSSRTRGLWWMSKKDSGNISPLHRQLVKRRTIVVTEDPKLHLAWIHDRIFIKPLPRYITSYAFWRDYLCTEAGSGGLERIRRAALGYLRTYYYLVKHESDLRIAQDPSLCLVPPDITWEQFCDFTSSLGDIADRDVSLRYAYGEIRLTRLNLYAPLLLGKSHFQRVEHQYGTYFARFYGPILFVIGITSVVLGGLQVVVSVGENGGGGWTGAALWVSVTAIVASCILLFTLGLLLVYKVTKEWKFAIRDRLRLLEEKRAAE